MKISTSETDALVSRSFDLKIVWPSNPKGSPEIFSATISSLLIYSEEEGLISLLSRSNTSAFTP